MDDIELSYKPLSLPEGEITEKDYDLYLSQPGLAKIVGNMVISPLEDSMKKEVEDSKKEKNKKVFSFPDFSVTGKIQTKSNLSPKPFYEEILRFLRIRADDSRVAEIPDIEKFEGIGYCISIDSLLKGIEKTRGDFTSHSKFPQLYWPKKKPNEDFIRELIIPEKNYSEIIDENARIVLRAKRFCSGLEAEVVKAFENSNKLWLKKETGFDEENIPELEKSPVQRMRKIAKGKYVFVSLVREDRLQYKDIIDLVASELKQINEGISSTNYRYTKSNGKFFVNISNVLNRIDALSSDKNFTKLNVRYEIAP